jgi:integrase
MTKLTAKSIENWKPQATRQEIPDAAARGLYLIVQPSGVKSFAIRGRHGGKTFKLSLTRGTSLAEARQQAADAYAALDKGHNPVATRKAAKAKVRAAAADTVRAVCEEYMRREGKDLRTARDRERSLQNHVYPAIGDRPVALLSRLEIVRLLENIGDDQGKERAAGLVYRYLNKIFNWYAVRNDEFKSPMVKGMYSRGAAKSRDRILTDDELRKIWTTAESSDSTFAVYVRFLLLTCARRTEASALTWNEIDGDNWILPARRNKTGMELVRPLSKKARDLLAKLPRTDSPYVFNVNGRPFNSFAYGKAGFDRDCGVTDWHLHDARRTGRTLLSRAGVSADHAERCLGHVIGGVRGVYDRHEFLAEKKSAFEALARMINQIVNPAKIKGNVHQLRRKTG